MLGRLLCLTLSLSLLQCLDFCSSGGPGLFVDGQGKGFRPRARSSGAVGARVAVLSWAVG